MSPATGKAAQWTLSRSTPRGLALAGAAIFTYFILLGGVATASADTLNVSLSAASGASGIPFTVTFTGADSPFDQQGDTPYLYALVRPANGVRCQPTFGDDLQVAGTDNPNVLYDADNNGDTVSDGNYRYASTFTPGKGSYIVCAWLETDSYDNADRGDVASQVVTAAGMADYTAVNTDTLSVSVSTSSPVKGIPLTVTLSGRDTPFDQQGDTPELYALVRRANGVGCQPTFGDDVQVAGTDNPNVLYDADNNGDTVSDGNFSYPASFTPGKGSYIVCAWLETDSDDNADEGDVASQVVTAAATASFSTSHPSGGQSPACVVPQFAGARLRTVKKRLRANHCAVGHVRYVRNRHVRKGHVIRLSSKPGARFAADTPVGIRVSKG